MLAAFEVYKNREKYFGKTFAPLAEPEGDYLPMATATNVQDLIRVAGLNREQMMALNPAIKPEVFYGDKELPKGYLLKVPPTRKEDVILAAQQLFMEKQYADYHVVEKGEDLATIAQKYDIDLDALMSTNGFLKNQKVKKGDILKLPKTDGDGQYSYIKKDKDQILDEVLEQKIREMEGEEDEAGDSVDEQQQ